MQFDYKLIPQNKLRIAQLFLYTEWGSRIIPRSRLLLPFFLFFPYFFFSSFIS